MRALPLLVVPMLALLACGGYRPSRSNPDTCPDAPATAGEACAPVGMQCFFNPPVGRAAICDDKSCACVSDGADAGVWDCAICQ